VKGTKKDAEKHLAELLYEIDSGGYTKPTHLTVGEYLKQWIDDYAVLHSRPSTVRSYRIMIRRHLSPALGGIKMIDLRPQHLESYYAKKLKGGRVDGTGGLSARSVHHHHRLIHTVLEHGVRQGLVARNAADAVEPPRPLRPRLKVVTTEDLLRLIEFAKNSFYFLPIYTAAYTGLRRGELLGLRWCDVNLDLVSISVTQTLYRVRGRGYVIQEPKSARGRRVVDLPPSLALLLRRHRKRQEEMGILVGKPLVETVFVFADPDGKPIDPDTLSHNFARVVLKAGLHNIRFHDLRHAHASLMLKAGIHPKIVSERLGHSSVAFTLDTYSHVVPSLQEQAAKRFDEMLEQDDISKRC
jgi:integrase